MYKHFHWSSPHICTVHIKYMQAELQELSKPPKKIIIFSKKTTIKKE